MFSLIQMLDCQRPQMGHMRGQTFRDLIFENLGHCSPGKVKTAFHILLDLPWRFYISWFQASSILLLVVLVQASQRRPYCKLKLCAYLLLLNFPYLGLFFLRILNFFKFVLVKLLSVLVQRLAQFPQDLPFLTGNFSNFSFFVLDQRVFDSIQHSIVLSSDHVFVLERLLGLAEYRCLAQVHVFKLYLLASF